MAASSEFFALRVFSCPPSFSEAVFLATGHIREYLEDKAGALGRSIEWDWDVDRLRERVRKRESELPVPRRSFPRP